MGSHEPADPKVPGPKTIKEKDTNQTKIVYNQEKPETILSEKKKVQKKVKSPKKTKNDNKKKHKLTVYMFFPDEMRSDLPFCCCFRLI